jgi:uncharacterized membrane-anchored protein
VVHLHEFGLKDHPLRAALASEMHVRKLPPMAAPTRIMQVVLLSDNSQVDRERAMLAKRCELGDSEPSSNFIVGSCNRLDVVWERHTEFSSYMFISSGPFDSPFEGDVFEGVARGWFADMPGQVVRGTQLALASRDFIEGARSWFSNQDLVICDVSDGAARLWSDFRIHPDGFGRLLLIDNGLTQQEASLVIQRLQELGNYRNMALLGLPIAQKLTARVSAYEARLAALSSAMAVRAGPDAELLRSLVELTAELAEMVAETRYRMSASRAYAQIVHDRLESLRVGRIKGQQTLGDFTDRRLLPAVRTCVSFSARLEDLSQRAAWASSLMRTRVDTALSMQNRDLLASMDRRTDLQLRLQQTVEGLSVVAISYYLVGLLGYVSHGLEAPWPRHDVLMAAVVPVVLLVTWLGLKRVTRRFHQA